MTDKGDALWALMQIVRAHVDTVDDAIAADQCEEEIRAQIYNNSYNCVAENHTVWAIEKAHRYENGRLVETYEHDPYSSFWDFHAVPETELSQTLEKFSRREVFYRLANYESDEPYEGGEDQPQLSLSRFVLDQWLEEDHRGDCTNEPFTCSRCFAERCWHKAGWIVGV